MAETHVLNEEEVAVIWQRQVFEDDDPIGLGHWLGHARADIRALCDTVRILLSERTGILTNMTEMNQIRALDKNAWRRVGETLGLTEEESAHTSHVLAVLAGRTVKREQLARKVLEVVSSERLTENLDNDGDRGYSQALDDVVRALQDLFVREGIEFESQRSS